MDMDSDSYLVTRLDVIETGRRRRWSDSAKIRIVEESFVGDRQASATARRHDISNGLLFRWRRAYREGRLGDAGASSFVPAVVVSSAGDAPDEPTSVGGRMEIVMSDGRRVIVGADVDAAALGRVLKVLERP